MIELYSNEPNRLVYHFMVEDEPVVAQDLDITIATSNDKVSFGVPEIITTGGEPAGETEFIVPNTILNDFRWAKIVVKYSLVDYGDFNEEFVVPIVKRYVRFNEINNILGEDALSWAEFVEVERNVRYRIDSYCHQSFNSWFGVQTVTSIDGVVSLPIHLDTLTSVAHKGLILTGFTLSEAGFDLFNETKLRTVSLFSNRASKKTMEIAGLWGYSSVPSQVRSAAIELIKSELCDDKVYRDKYIDNIRNENIRIQFRDEAYSGETTGNAFVDDILNPYRVFHIGVV